MKICRISYIFICLWIKIELPRYCCSQKIPSKFATNVVRYTVQCWWLNSCLETFAKIQKLLKPPSPQFWGSPDTQSPPELGDLGGIQQLRYITQYFSTSVRCALSVCGAWCDSSKASRRVYTPYDRYIFLYSNNLIPKTESSVILTRKNAHIK